MMNFKIRDVDGAIIGKTGAASLPATAEGLSLEAGEDDVGINSHWWNGTAFEDRTPIAATTVQLVVGVAQEIEIPADGWTALGQDLAQGGRTVTAAAAGTQAVIFSGKYSGSITLDAQTIAGWKAARWADALAYRNAMQAGGCNTPSGRVQTDDRSQTLISSTVLAASLRKAAGEPFSVNWTMADNSVVPLDADAMIAIGFAAMSFVAACQDAGTAIRDAIDGAATIEALAAIDITAGYPSATA